MSSTALTHVSTTLQGMVAAADFMPVFDMGLAIQRRNLMVEFTKQIMVDGTDYGTILGSPKPCLLKAGAEKLCTFFGLVSEFILTECVEDWTGKDHSGEPFFYYRYRCRLLRNGKPLGEGEGSCNTWESKYRYRWYDEALVEMNGLDKSKLLKRGGAISEFEFAIEKSETGGKYGKPAEYWQAFKDAIANGTARRIAKKIKSGEERPAWEIDAIQYRVPNLDVADQVNTCQKMAQKRALVAATLIGVNASEYFTQDMEDLQPIDVPYEVLPHTEPGAANVPVAKVTPLAKAATPQSDESDPFHNAPPLTPDDPGKEALKQSRQRTAAELREAMELARAEYSHYGQSDLYARIKAAHLGDGSKQPTLKEARQCVAEMESILVQVRQQAAEQEVA